jgi:putative DNA primase/helicase
MDNYHEVVHQMQAFGVEFVDSKDLPLKIDLPKRKGCGLKGKWWYWLRTFRPDSGGEFIVGRFGSYKSGDSQKVEINWKPLGDSERARRAAEDAAARAKAEATRAADAELAALGAADLWRRASKVGESAYLVRKGVVGEACRYLANGELLIPLLRYDLVRDQALRGVQRIKPDGGKLYTKGFIKSGCTVRLGDALPGYIILICEGYATGLTLRMATDCSLAVYVALDAGNLQHAVPLIRQLHPDCRILICADDDWRTRDQFTKKLNNPGRTAAMRAAKASEGVEVVYPIFQATARGEKDTDYNDLHARQGLEAVRRQMRTVVQGMRSIYG